MNTNEFTIETGSPPTVSRGAHKSPLFVKVEALKTGEVLRWRPLPPFSPTAASRISTRVKEKHPERRFFVTKVAGGFDIYRLSEGCKNA